MTATEFEAVRRSGRTRSGLPLRRRRDEVRRHVGRRPGEDPGRRAKARVPLVRARANRVVGVLSAMGHTTDELARPRPRGLPHARRRASSTCSSPSESASPARCVRWRSTTSASTPISLTGSQAGIVTDTSHGKAKIVEVRARRIHEALDRDGIVLVAGFQGVSTDHEVTTLGRGGSDTTAVALAAALGAGRARSTPTSTASSRLIRGSSRRAQARRRVSYEEMLEMAASGARVLALRSVEFARNHGVDAARALDRSRTARARGSREEDERCSRRR